MYRKALFLALLLILPVDGKKFGGFGGGSSRGSSAGRVSAGGNTGAHYQTGGSGYHPSGSYPQQSPHPGGYPGQTGGYHPPQGGYHQSAPGYNQGGYHMNQPHYQTGFNQGTGLGSASRGGQWKTALAAGAAGALGGILVYEAGKAIIKSATEPAHINGRPYYFNNEDHKYQGKAGELTCSMPLDTLIKQTQPASTAAPAAPTTEAPAASNGTETTTPATATPTPDQLLSNLQFQDGSRPKTVTWSCKAGSEVCCGTDCCPAPPQQAPPNAGPPSYGAANTGKTLVNIIIIVLLVVLMLSCCCCFIMYKFFRSAFDTCCPMFREDSASPYNDDSKYNASEHQGYASYQAHPDGTVPMQAYPGMQQQGSYPPQQGGYPPQQQSGYPPSGGYVYPSQPAPYQQYPPQQYPQY